MTRLAFHLIAAAGLFVIPAQLKSGVSLWHLEKDAFLQLAGGAAAYLLAACILEFVRWRRTRIPFLAVPALALSAYGLYAIGLLVAGGAYSRLLLIVMIAAGCVLLTLSLANRRILAVATVGCAAALGAMLFIKRDVERSPSWEPPSFRRTMYEWLDLMAYPGRLPPSKVLGGALAPLDDAYLLAMGDGRLFRLRFRGESDSLDVEALAARVPINSEEFDARADKGLHREWFRVADILVQKTAQGIRLLASHHYWKPESACFVVRVSKLETTIDDLRAKVVPDEWSTLFESKPCMPTLQTEGITMRHRLRLQHGFLGKDVGGGMAALDDSSVLVALGHHGFDGVDSPLMVSQDTMYDMGKAILIDVRSGRARRYTLGHRNPQGLALASDGSVWSTEHGPRGGDELNLIVDSANYGWPFETYGTQYGARIWPLSATPGEHETYRAPIFAWLPSIAVTSVFQSQGRAVPAWRGDLLIGSLKDKSLWRVRVRQGRAVFTERILVNRRIRDVVEGNDGRIVMWAEKSEIVTVRPSRLPEQGELLFVTKCGDCHAFEQGTTHGIGPDLYRVINRRVAASRGFEYSPALREVGGYWERDRLSDFLSDPAGFAPGTSMDFKGVSDSVSRAAIIKYLGSK